MQTKDRPSPLLEVEDLSISYHGRHGVVRAVDHISYTVGQREVLGLVGESGSGKSASAYAIMRLLPPSGRVDGGHIRFEGRDVLGMTKQELCRFRGGDAGMIFQDPMSCLDPAFTIGHQLTETLKAHIDITAREAHTRAIDMLRAVGIKSPQDMMKRYQFELSGGMRQRVMIAIALLCSPRLLIADEPTTALDVTIQAQIIQLIKQLKDSMGMSVVFITHNFGIVAQVCDRVAMMYGGRIVEQGSVDDLFLNPLHPYTAALMKAIPGADLLSRKPLVPIEGTPFDAINPPSGCAFHPRCKSCMDICRKKAPGVTEVSPGHSASCWLIPREGSEV